MKLTSEINKIDYYLNLSYKAIVVRDKNFDEAFYYYAYYKECKFIKGTGETPKEAIDDLKEALNAI